MGEENNGNYVVLARKYRPQSFNELLGQDALVRTITNAIKNRYGAYMENSIKSVVLINDEEEDFIIRIITEEDTIYGPETTTIEEYLNGPESHTIACQLLYRFPKLCKHLYHCISIKPAVLQ